MSILAINDQTFDHFVRKNRVSLVEFGAAWCPPCKVLLPILDRLSQKYEGKVSTMKVDCDESPEIASRYDIMSMPTVILFVDGEAVEKVIGLRPSTVYEDLLNQVALEGSVNSETI